MLNVEHLVSRIRQFLLLQGQFLDLRTEVTNAGLQLINVGLDLGFPNGQILQHRSVRLQRLLHRIMLIIDPGLHPLQEHGEVAEMAFHRHQLLLLPRLVLRTKNVVRRCRQTPPARRRDGLAGFDGPTPRIACSDYQLSQSSTEFRWKEYYRTNCGK